MAIRPDKKTRKEQLSEWRAKQRANARGKLPLPDDQMQALFDMLDVALPKRGCNHTLGMVREWCEQNDHPFDSLAAWCQENGGYCDCEVQANCEQQWQEAIHDVD